MKIEPRTLADEARDQAQDDLRTVNSACANLSLLTGLRASPMPFRTPNGTWVYQLQIQGIEYSPYVSIGGLAMIVQGMLRVAETARAMGFAHADRLAKRGTE